MVEPGKSTVTRPNPVSKKVDPLANWIEMGQTNNT